MRDSDCVAFLQWSLPRLGLRWSGFRKVRRTVCKRVARRIRELGLPDHAAYRDRLAADPDEWRRLEAFCRIPISRFWRDRALFDWLAATALPACASKAARRHTPTVRCWSAGCASGEEAYSLRLAWAMQAEAGWPSVQIDIVATDADATMIARAKTGRYSAGSVRELSPEQRERAFDRDGETYVLHANLKQGVTVLQQDLRNAWPDGPFDLILCRNAAFTYFDALGQRETLLRLAQRLETDGLLILGGHERLPDGDPSFLRAGDALPVYSRP